MHAMLKKIPKLIKWAMKNSMKKRESATP